MAITQMNVGTTCAWEQHLKKALKDQELKFLFLDNRYNLAEDMLENLMLVHLNPEFYYKVKDLEIKQLVEQQKIRF